MFFFSPIPFHHIEEKNDANKNDFSHFEVTKKNENLADGEHELTLTLNFAEHNFHQMASRMVCKDMNGGLQKCVSFIGCGGRIAKRAFYSGPNVEYGQYKQNYVKITLTKGMPILTR